MPLHKHLAESRPRDVAASFGRRCTRANLVAHAVGIDIAAGWAFLVAGVTGSHFDLVLRGSVAAAESCSSSCNCIAKETNFVADAIRVDVTAIGT